MFGPLQLELAAANNLERLFGLAPSKEALDPWMMGNWRGWHASYFHDSIRAIHLHGQLSTWRYGSKVLFYSSHGTARLNLLWCIVSCFGLALGLRGCVEESNPRAI